MPKKRRDDFPAPVIRELAKRVGNVCSVPGCGQSTSGPHSDSSKGISIGVAAHITAAAPRGPRYDSTLTPDQPPSTENWFWACPTHGRLIDSDESRYTVEQLRAWRSQAEARALDALEGGSRSGADDQRHDREHSRWLNRFEGTSCEFQGRTVYLAWDGPLDEVKTEAPRIVMSEELAAIHCALC